MKARVIWVLGYELCTAALCASEVRLQLPLARTAYQCNESIPLTVLRTGSQVQGGRELGLRLAATDSRLTALTRPEP